MQQWWLRLRPIASILGHHVLKYSESEIEDSYLDDKDDKDQP